MHIVRKADPFTTIPISLRVAEKFTTTHYNCARVI
jgi:hypothetical protein